MTETSIVEGIVQCCENAGKAIPSPLINGEKMAMTDYSKRR
ncbi:hypothetical protein [Burkholderia seminalis]|nr:hypothetical protein [Burkholderia seminalis]